MRGRPGPGEAAPYYFRYIEQAAGDDPVAMMEGQLEGNGQLLSKISEDQSLHRYAAEKWSIRQVLSHMADTERLFAFRAMWFARSLQGALPSFDQELAAANARADDISWAKHREEFRAARASTIAFFRNLPEDAWMKTGVASGYTFTVRALAFIIAGHEAYHIDLLRERYLAARV